MALHNVRDGLTLHDMGRLNVDESLGVDATLVLVVDRGRLTVSRSVLHVRKTGKTRGVLKLEVSFKHGKAVIGRGGLLVRRHSDSARKTWVLSDILDRVTRSLMRKNAMSAEQIGVMIVMVIMMNMVMRMMLMMMETRNDKQ